MKLVFFDFDGTLTSRDTILPLCLFLGRKRGASAPKIGRVFAALMLLKLRILSNHRFKEEFCRRLLAGETRDRVDALAGSFATEHVAAILRPRVVRILHEHRQNGDEVYIVSSNFDFVLRPLLLALNVNGVFATEAEIADGRYTGRLLRPACAGLVKLSRVIETFGADRVREAVAYGDSADDRQLLKFVATPVWIK